MIPVYGNRGHNEESCGRNKTHRAVIKRHPRGRESWVMRLYRVIPAVIRQDAGGRKVRLVRSSWGNHLIRPFRHRPVQRDSGTSGYGQIRGRSWPTSIAQISGEKTS